MSNERGPDPVKRRNTLPIMARGLKATRVPIHAALLPTIYRLGEEMKLSIMGA